MGEGVAVPGVTEAGLYRRTALDSLLFPRHWAAQRLFESLPLSSPEGDLHPCLGVFVVDGRACGVYGRLARRPIIDGRAQDAAVLIGAPEEVLVP
jgi:hypothetical protein